MSQSEIDLSSFSTNRSKPKSVSNSPGIFALPFAPTTADSTADSYADSKYDQKTPLFTLTSSILPFQSCCVSIENIQPLVVRNHFHDVLCLRLDIKSRFFSIPRTMLIPTGEFCSIPISFLAYTQGLQRADLTITAFPASKIVDNLAINEIPLPIDGLMQTAVVHVSAEAVDPQIVISPASNVDFGLVAVVILLLITYYIVISFSFPCFIYIYF